MELFSLATVRLSGSDLQRLLNIQNLPEWCASIHKVLSARDEHGEIDGVWGKVRVHRELIHDGVRFTLPGSPYALQWTISPAPLNSARVQVHCTSNRHDHDPAQLAVLQKFVNDWRDGLESWPQRRSARHNRACVRCEDTFGGFG